MIETPWFVNKTKCSTSTHLILKYANVSFISTN